MVKFSIDNFDRRNQNINLFSIRQSVLINFKLDCEHISLNQQKNTEFWNEKK